jgi:DNA-binding response OmpR family regulator
MRALIVDDSRAGKAGLREVLSEAGFQVLESDDSLEALGLLEARGTVDLALVNWDLPEADGLRFALNLRSTKRFDGTRIIMMTRLPSIAEILEAIQMGVDDCIVKPCTRTKLVQKLTELRLVKA